MPEATQPVAPVPAAGSPGANNTNATTQPKPAVQAATPPPAKSAEAIALEAERTQLAQERKIFDRKMALQQKKYADEIRAKDKTLGEKLSKLSEYEKRESFAKLNKTAYLQSLYGKDWFNEITTEKINGGAPTADVVAYEIANLRGGLREEFKGELSARDAAQEKATQAAQAKTEAEVRRQLKDQAEGFWESSATEFPVLSELGDSSHIATLLTGRIEAKYNSTLKRDAETGQILRDGQLLTMKEAAEELEAQILGLAEKAVGHQKYAERFKPKPVAPVTPKYEAQQPRRTLSNDLTGSTPGRQPPQSDAERRQRAITAWQNARKPTT